MLYFLWCESQEIMPTRYLRQQGNSVVSFVYIQKYINKVCGSGRRIAYEVRHTAKDDDTYPHDRALVDSVGHSRPLTTLIQAANNQG